MNMKHGEYMPWQMYSEVVNMDLKPVVVNVKRKISNVTAALPSPMLGSTCVNMGHWVHISPSEGKYFCCNPTTPYLSQYVLARFHFPDLCRLS
jgi:hypothetical protein